jgi:hypothetical protein
VTVLDVVGCYTGLAGGTAGSAAERGGLAYCACAAAASGPPSICGGARLRRRTNPARRPLGAAVVVDGVGRRWPPALPGGPLPWADAGYATSKTDQRGPVMPVARR